MMLKKLFSPFPYVSFYIIARPALYSDITFLQYAYAKKTTRRTACA